MDSRGTGGSSKIQYGHEHHATEALMELRQLRYLIAAVEQGSISGASARLHVAQPAVSRQIHSLELEIGAPLLERLPRGVTATLAGESLIKDARRILSELEIAAERARLVSDGGSAHLRLAFNETYSLNSVITESLHEFRVGHPNVSLSVASMNTRAQIAALRAGELDLGFFFDRNPRDVELSADVIFIDEVSLVVPSTSPLASRDDIHLADLEASDFIWFPRTRDPWFYDRLMAACRAAGFSPRIKQEAMNDSSMMALVAADLGVAFSPRQAFWKARHQIAFVPVADLQIELHLELVWRSDNQSTTVQDFRDIVKMKRQAPLS
jgi:DNA-binding transcriptional LysR family regulator